MALRSFSPMAARSASLVACIAVMLTAASRGHADGPSPAEKLFWVGREAMKHGDYAHARAALEESLRLQSTPGTLLNLAVCEEQLGQLVAALQHLNSLDASLNEADERHAFIKDGVRRLNERIPSLSVQIPKGLQGTVRVTLDDRELTERELESPLRVDPGPHALVVSSSRSTSPKRYELRLDEHQTVTRVVDPADLGEPTPPPEPAGAPPSAAPPNEPGRSRTWAYVLGGVGVGALAVSAGTGIAALGKRDAALAGCTGKFCTADALHDADVARTYGWISTGTLLGGLASVGAATYLFLSRGPATAATSIGVGWVSSVHDARVVVSGSF
jgi:hypothetical protein